MPLFGIGLSVAIVGSWREGRREGEAEYKDLGIRWIERGSREERAEVLPKTPMSSIEKSEAAAAEWYGGGRLVDRP